MQRKLLIFMLFLSQVAFSKNPDPYDEKIRDKTFAKVLLSQKVTAYNFRHYVLIFPAERALMVSSQPPMSIPFTNT